MIPEYDRLFLETILSSVADGVFTVDSDLRVTSINPAAERVAGATARDAQAELAGRGRAFAVERDGASFWRATNAEPNVERQRVER